MSNNTAETLPQILPDAAQAVPVTTSAQTQPSAPTPDRDAWQVISLLPRLDALNHAELIAEFDAIRASGGRRIALDLTQNRFFSLAAIQVCVNLAKDLAAEGGRFALIAPIERTQRHFQIYGSLKQITVVRSSNGLVHDATTAVIVRPRLSSSPEVL